VTARRPTILTFDHQRLTHIVTRVRGGVQSDRDAVLGGTSSRSFGSLSEDEVDAWARAFVDADMGEAERTS
jgi:hypothetical protein